MGRSTIKYKKVKSLIKRASKFGHLGFFVGSGFSKAACVDAPDFSALMERVASDLDLPVDFFDDADSIRGLSYPQLASKFRDILAKEGLAGVQVGDRGAARVAVLQAASSNCALSPDANTRARLSEAFSWLNPHWFITTNYDYVIEQSLSQRSVTVGPRQAFVPRVDPVPVFHLHGHRQDPDSMILLEEDYAVLLGPVQYRQLRLSLALVEATTVMIGYGLGDINVLSALEWKRAFQDHSPGLASGPAQGEIIQVVYTQGECGKPYRRDDGLIVVETDDLVELLSDLGAETREYSDYIEKTERDFREWLGNAETLDDVFSDKGSRELLGQLLDQSNELISAGQLVSFLEQAIEPVWIRARSDGGFAYYAKVLELVIDILVEVNPEHLRPPLVQFIGTQLEDLASYMDPSGERKLGESWEATDLWCRRNEELPDETRGVLLDWANARRSQRLCKFLKQ